MSTDNAAKRYLFTPFGGKMNSQTIQFTSLYQGKKEAKAPPPELKYSDEDLEKFKNDSFESGIAAGLKQANEQYDKIAFEQNQEIEKALTNVSEQIKIFSEKNQKQIKVISEKLADLSFQAAKKIAGAALKNNPVERVSELLQKFAADIAKIQQEAKIYVNDKIHDKIKERFSSIAESSAIKFEIFADAELAASDIRLEWKGGGAEIKHDDLMHEVEKIISDIT